MKISDYLNYIKVQLILKKTRLGRNINKNAIECIKSTLQDTENYGVNAINCRNCGIIISSLLVEKGCPNCGSLDLDV